MENPNTRPYTTEELEALINEEAFNSNMPKNNKGSKTKPSPVILQDNNPIFTDIIPVESISLNVEVSADKPQTPSKLKTHAPLIILGVILTGIGIYLYYDYRKRKEAQNLQKPDKK